MDEAGLVERAREGDLEAYGELVRRHQALAARVAAVVGAPDPEDVTQEAFVKAFRALPRFKAEAPFRPWLLRIVANEARNRARSTRRQAGLQLRLAAQPAVAGEAPEDAAVRAERRAELLAAVATLRARPGGRRLPLPGRAVRSRDGGRARVLGRHREVAAVTRPRPAADGDGRRARRERGVSIDSELRDLAAALEASPVDVERRVLERLAAGEGKAPRLRRWWVGLGALVVAVGTLVLPGPRAAIADWLHIGGVEIREVDPSATSAPARTDDDLGFGPEVSLERAAAALGRPPLLPAGLGHPDHVYLDASYPTYQWGHVYLSEFVSGSDQPWVIKKLVPRANNVESVLVNGGPGFWIEGPHEVAFGLETERTVGDVLLWEQDGLTLRLEGPATKHAALELAGTIGS